MRRTVAVAFLSALLAFTLPALAQRGGRSGGLGGGHFGGSAGHFGGGFAGSSFGHSMGFAPRSFASAPRFVSPAPTRAFGSGYRLPSTGVSSAWRHEGDHDRHGDFRYRSPYRGYGYGGYPYVYANSWELLPWDLGYPGFSDDDEYDSGPDVEQQQPAASVAPPDDGYRPDYQGPVQGPAGPYDYAPPPPAESYVANSSASEPALMLIFNDGHQEAIHNYVLTGNAVIVLDQAASGRQQRIPLASINLPATEQAAAQAGLDFTPPA